MAYFNVDVAVAGPDFSASAVPSLKKFMREITKSVPSPMGDTVYQEWRANRHGTNEHRASNAPPQPGDEVHVSDLGSGSDFTPFLQHVGVPSTDIGSGGPYGVYHSVFDNYAWFTLNADPHFVYLQQMARVLGLEAVRMADTDVLPYDYEAYAREMKPILSRRSAKPGMRVAGHGFWSGAGGGGEVCDGRGPCAQVADESAGGSWRNSMQPCVRRKRRWCRRPACQTGPGTSTRSTLRGNIRAMPRW